LSKYAFGDTDLARQRLAIVANVFAPTTRTLLRDLPRTFLRYILDLGCGSGHTTALLRHHFPLAEITGFDVSAAMLEEARARVPDATFAAFDVTGPLLLPADLVYARFLLGHLTDVRAVLATWATSLRPGNGLLVCEEPVGYVSDDPWFARYEAAVTAVVAETGATLWAAGVLDHGPPSCDRAIDRVVEHPVTSAGGRDVLAQCHAVATSDTGRRSTRRAFPSRRSIRQYGCRDVANASGSVQEARRLMPAFFSTSGLTPNSRHAPYAIPLRWA
jgi:SAM-dependent methyltransferase